MKYFTIAELCRSGEASMRGINNDPGSVIAARIMKLINNALDPIRESWGSAIKVTSGYRCSMLNKMVKGSPTSAHITGYAADLVPVNGKMAAFQRKVLEWAARNKFDQIILEYPKDYVSSWIHVGLYNAKGEQRGQILYTTDGKHYPNVTEEFYNVSDLCS